MKQVDNKAFEWLNNNELSYKIWDNKYRNNNESFDDWLDRVSRGDFQVEELIRNKKFLFAGRILSNRGILDRKGTLSNCYVLAPPEDNLESIFKTASDMARTFSYGGGVGIDLSKLRPSGARVNNAAKTTCGPVGFMELYSQTTGTIGQDNRRGALMISLDINHPDIEQFIDIKTDLSKVNYANISVRVNDEFMKAVEEDKDYILRWPCDYNVDVHSEQYLYNNLYSLNDKIYIKKVKARDLFNKLVKNNWNYAEPGVLYWDNIQNYNLLNNTDFKYAGVNPCAEEPLPNGGSCLLGSINLSEFVLEPFTDNAHIDYEALANTTDICIKALNDVLDEGLTLHPLEVQRNTVRDYRQIGLGTIGLADALIKLQVTYGSKRSLDIIEDIYSNIAIQAVESSLALAKEFGCYPKCEKEKLVESSFIANLGLSPQTLEEIKKYGLRNSQLLTCAPTGSISTMIAASGGVEPIFAMHYTRTTKSLEGKDKVFEVYTKIAQDWLDTHQGQKLPEYFIESGKINPLDRVKVQGVLQGYIDASISSTVNLDEEATVEDIYNIYMNAWKCKLKGITIFRQNCARIAILNTNTTKKDEPTVKFNTIVPISRKKMGTTSGQTFCQKCACGTLYVTANRDKDGNFVELFTHTSKGGICQANLNALTRSISLALRSGIKIDEIIDQLKGIHCPACTNVKAKGVKIDGLSCPDIISKVMSKFTATKVIVNEKAEVASVTQDNNKCPECGSTLEHTGGCVQCQSCGWSKCN